MRVKWTKSSLGRYTAFNGRLDLTKDEGPDLPWTLVVDDVPRAGHWH